MEVASGLAGGTLMTVAGQTMLAVAGQSMNDAPSVIIIGAGLSGVAMAHQLKHGLGFSDFTVYEKGKNIGNGWADASADYACSHPNILYSFSFNQSYPWKHEYASRDEITSYLRDTVSRHDLQQHIHTGVEVIKATWIDDKNTWCVRLRDLETSEEYNRYCTVLISAAGASLDRGATRKPALAAGSASGAVHASDQYLPFFRRIRRLAALLAQDLTYHEMSSPSDPMFAHSEVEVIGARDGTSLSQYWKESRGPQAYWGSLVASFPNFGLVLGPNAYPAQSSPTYAIEASVAYLSRNLVSPILDNRATRVEVRQAVEDRWARSLRRHEPKSATQKQSALWRKSGIAFNVQSLLYGSRGLVYKNGQTAWWMNMFVRWAKSIRFRTWLTLLLGLALLRLKSVKTRVDRARADVEKYVPYEKQAIELAGKLKDSVLK